MSFHFKEDDDDDGKKKVLLALTWVVCQERTNTHKTHSTLIQKPIDFVPLLPVKSPCRLEMKTINLFLLSCQIQLLMLYHPFAFLLLPLERREKKAKSSQCIAMKKKSSVEKWRRIFSHLNFYENIGFLPSSHSATHSSTLMFTNKESKRKKSFSYTHIHTQ